MSAPDHTEPPDNEPARRITPQCQPIFPCWLFCRSFRGWRHASAQRDQFADDTHWHPDQPSAPTCVLTEGEPDLHKRMIEALRNCGTPASQPTHSAQEAAERAARELMALYEQRPSDPVYFHLHRWNEKEIVAIILKHANRN